MPLCFREHSEFYQILRPEKYPRFIEKNAMAGTHVNIKVQSLPEVFVASNLTRKELLKQDKFTVEAEHTVDYLSTHRKEAVRYGAIGLAVILVVLGVLYYRSSQKSVREQILGEDIALSTAAVGQAAAPGGASFPTQAAKDAAVTKAFTKLSTDYSGPRKRMSPSITWEVWILTREKWMTRERNIRTSPTMPKRTTGRWPSSRWRNWISPKIGSPKRKYC